MSEFHGKNYIGKETSSAGSATFQAYDPALGASIEPAFCEATTDEVNRAVELADRAAAAYRRVEPGRRAEFLERVAAAIVEEGDELLERAHAESGLPAARLTGERGRTVSQIRMFADLVREGSWVEASIDHGDPDRKPAPKPDMRRMLTPLGAVAVFGASNFPLAFSVAGGDTASALAAGCPVVVKAHPAHPGTCEIVARAFLKAIDETGMPEGVFSMLHGTSHEVGLAMVRHPKIRAVAFTGSLVGGRALFDAAAARPEPVPVYAEMGSVNPVFVLPGALVERGTAIAQGLQQSVTLGVGQFCTNPGLIVGLDSDPLAALVRDLEKEIAASPPATMLHRGIRNSFEAGVERCSKVPGVEVAARASEAAEAEKTQAAAVVMTAAADTFLANAELSDEVFGPSTIVVRCADRDELLRVADGLAGNLTATLQGTEADLAEHRDLIEILETKVGRLLFNGFPTGVEICSSTQHGGPYPATTDSRTTSVGPAAISRFARPICYQNFPRTVLPPELRDDNVREIWRKVDGEMTR